MSTFVFFFFHIVLALGLIYFVLGFIISFEIVGAMSGSDYAVSWIQKQFRYEELYYAVIIFYPMLKLAYFFLEYIPAFFTHDIRCSFNLDALFMDLFNYE